MRQSFILLPVAFCPEEAEVKAWPPVLPGSPLLENPGKMISGKGNVKHKVKDGDGAPRPGHALECVERRQGRCFPAHV